VTLNTMMLAFTLLWNVLYRSVFVQALFSTTNAAGDGAYSSDHFKGGMSGDGSGGYHANSSDGPTHPAGDGPDSSDHFNGGMSGDGSGGHHANFSDGPAHSAGDGLNSSSPCNDSMSGDGFGSYYSYSSYSYDGNDITLRTDGDYTHLTQTSRTDGNYSGDQLNGSISGEGSRGYHANSYDGPTHSADDGPNSSYPFNGAMSGGHLENGISNVSSSRITGGDTIENLVLLFLLKPVGIALSCLGVILLVLVNLWVLLLVRAKLHGAKLHAPTVHVIGVPVDVDQPNQEYTDNSKPPVHVTGVPVDVEQPNQEYTDTSKSLIVV